METKDIVLSILPILTLVLGAYLNHKLGEKSKKTEHVLKYKEEKYANMILYLQGFVGNTASPDIQKDFLKELYKSWLYASDWVVTAVNNLVEYIKIINLDTPLSDSNKKIWRDYIGEIVLEMRKDLLWKTDLKSADFRYTDIGNWKK